MSVVLEMSDTSSTQGWSGSFNPKVTNFGDENIKEVFLKVVDSAVFKSLGVGDYNSCLNDFCVKRVYFYTPSVIGGQNFLGAGETKGINLKGTIKAGAPAGVHPINCYWQFSIY